MIKTAQKGFTLIELMIVIAIIGILASIAIPQFASFRIKAFNSAAQADVKNVGTATEAFYSDVYAYPDAVNVADTAARTITLTDTAAATPTVMTANLSEKVEFDIAVGTVTATKRCLAAKHTAGDVVMTANTDAYGVQSTAPVAASIDKTMTAAAAGVPACGI